MAASVLGGTPEACASTTPNNAHSKSAQVYLTLTVLPARIVNERRLIISHAPESFDSRCVRAGHPHLRARPAGDRRGPFHSDPLIARTTPRAADAGRADLEARPPHAGQNGEGISQS